MAKVNKKAAKKKRNYFSLKEINPVIRILTLSDLLIVSGFGLISPIFAVFVTDKLEGANLAVVGIATTVYLLSKSFFQVPVSFLLDKFKGERDDFWALFVGSALYSLIPLVYLVVSTPNQLYVAQFFYGLFTAATIPSWYAIFTRHIDKEREGTEWGVYSTLIDLGGALTASLGGFLALHFGFSSLFVIVSVMSFLGTGFLLIVYKNMEYFSSGKKKKRRVKS